MSGTRSVAETALMMQPDQGSRAFPLNLNFQSTGVIADDLAKEMQQALMSMVQSVFIDNSQNSTTFTLTTYVAGVAINIQVQPYWQGWYPVAIDIGTARFTAVTTAGVSVPVCFVNVAMPYFSWGPASGVLVVPALANAAVNFDALAAGDNTLVAAVAGESIRMYRCYFFFAGATNVQFFNGPSVNNLPLSGLMTMFAGGLISLNPSGVPWFTCSADEPLVLNSSAAVNMGGMIGYQQS
jgi:hypothetical protein